MADIVPRIDRSVQPTPLDKLIVARAIEKRWHAEMVEEQEAALKAELRQAKETMGIDRMTASKFLGAKAGMIYMAKKKGKPSEEVTRFYAYDLDKLTDWMDRERPDTDCFAADNLELFAEWYFHATGEVPDGCSVERYQTEEVPESYTPTLRVDDGYVAEALLGEGGNLFENAQRMMLGEGDGGN